MGDRTCLYVSRAGEGLLDGQLQHGFLASYHPGGLRMFINGCHSSHPRECPRCLKGSPEPRNPGVSGPVGPLPEEPRSLSLARCAGDTAFRVVSRDVCELRLEGKAHLWGPCLRRVLRPWRIPGLSTGAVPLHPSHSATLNTGAAPAADHTVMGW